MRSHNLLLIKVTCPNGIYYQHMCILDCQSGVPSTENMRECVTSTCPPGFSNTTDNVICNKPFSTKSGPCPTNTTEWVANQCYPDCPLPLLEGGTVCIKPTRQRPTEEPTCAWGYAYDKRCEIQAWFVWFMLFLTLLVVLPFVFLALYARRRY